MSTDLKTNGKHDFYLTRHFGGTESGTCVQITARVTNNIPGHISVTRDQALFLAADLIIFANGLEQEDQT